MLDAGFQIVNNIQSEISLDIAVFRSWGVRVKGIFTILLRSSYGPPMADFTPFGISLRSTYGNESRWQKALWGKRLDVR